MSIWHVETNNNPIQGTSTRVTSDKPPVLTERGVWEFSEGGETTLLVRDCAVIYIKRIVD